MKAARVTALAATALLAVAPSADAFQAKKIKIDVLIQGTQTMAVVRANGFIRDDPRTDSTNPCVFRESVHQLLRFKVHVHGRAVYRANLGPTSIEVFRAGRWMSMFPATGSELATYRVINRPDFEPCGWTSEPPDQLALPRNCEQTRPFPAGPGISVETGATGGMLLRSPFGLIPNPGRRCAASSELVDEFWDRIAVGPNTGAKLVFRDFLRRPVVRTHLLARACLESLFGNNWQVAGSRLCRPRPFPSSWDQTGVASRYAGALVLDWTATFTRLGSR